MSDLVFLGAAKGFENAALDITDAARSYERPSVQFRPRIFVDEGKWCALYGENLQDGVAGFGDSPDAAMKDFDAKWRQCLPSKGGCDE